MKTKRPEMGHLRQIFAATLLIGVIVSPPAWSHPDIEARIRAVTEMIDDDPGNARLLISRGELHAEHEDWGAALYDFDLAATVDPSYVAVDFHRGRLLHGIGEFAEAESAFKSFLHHRRPAPDPSPQTALAHLLLGELLETEKRWQEAAMHYDQGIRLSPHANPGFYVARARALIKASGANYERAIRGLDRRLVASPGLVSLQEYAIELELDRGNVEGAMVRVRKLIDAYPALPRWRLRLAHIQRSDGKIHDARRTYLEARDYMDSLPGHLQSKLRRSGFAADLERSVSELE